MSFSHESFRTTLEMENSDAFACEMEKGMCTIYHTVGLFLVKKFQCKVFQAFTCQFRETDQEQEREDSFTRGKRDMRQER